MESTHDPQPEEVLEFVFEHFGGWSQQIEPQFQRSETFRALCNDYLLCAYAMERWQSSDLPIAAQRAEEYAESMTELETEIRDWLESSQAAIHGAPAADD